MYGTEQIKTVIECREKGWSQRVYSVAPSRGGRTAFKTRGSQNPKRCGSLFLMLRLWCLRPAVSPDREIA